MTNKRFEWLHFLDLTHSLLSRGSEEALCSATSHAYYGLFGPIRARLETQMGRQFSTASNVHQQVISVLRNSQRPEVSKLGEDLDRLRRERNQADYDSRPFPIPRAQMSLARASRIEERLSLLR